MSQPRFFPPLSSLWRVLMPAGLVVASAMPALAEESLPARAQPLPDIETAGQRLGWLSSEEIAALPDAQRPPVDRACHGAWVTPISPRVYAGEINQSDALAVADSLMYRDNGEALLEGRVKINQPGRQVEADSGFVTQNRDFARFDGNIRLAEPGILLTGEQATVNLNNRSAQLLGSEFIANPMHAHGQAERIRRYENGLMRIEQGIFTTCAPGSRSWSFKARDIVLDQQSGLGTMRDATLRIQDVPVLYLPYYQFPITDARQSGFLQPMFRRTTSGGFDIATPLYLNLAPNMDATLTPRYFTLRGGMVQGEFRYLDKDLGSGVLRGGYLPNDQVTNTDRKQLTLQQNVQLSNVWSARTNYNYISDKFYGIDIGRNLLSTSILYQERLAEVRRDEGNWHFIGRTQSFQTVDENIALASRPYARLPQLILMRDRDLGTGWQQSLRSELTDFRRSTNDGSIADVEGMRLRVDPAIRYDATTSWGYVRPGLRLTHLQYQLQGAGRVESAPSVTQPTASVDAGLYFDRVADNGSTQTIEPRLFYLYSPYRNQTALPNFDTVNNTFTYEQVFRGSRFSGGDRVDDANQLSAGVTTRHLDADGQERFQAGLGQILFFRDRLVQLPNATAVTATQPTSSFAGKLSANIDDSRSVHADVLMDPEGLRLSQYSVTASYLPRGEGSVFNAGYRYRRLDPTIGQKEANLALMSFVQPLNANWSVIGLLQYDTALQQAQQKLFGISYESCCWQVRLFKRTLVVDTTLTPGITERNRDAILLELTLKGFGNSSGAIDKLLARSITGYATAQKYQEDDY